MPDLRDAAGNTQTGEPLKTAAEVVASRLAETVEEGRTPAQGVGGDVPVRGGADRGSRGRHDSPLSAASMLIGLGVGVGMGLLVGRRRRQATTAAGA